VSGRGGSGSLGSGRTAGYAIGEGRTSPWLEAIAGIRSDHVPGWAPSPCRLPGPVTRYVQVSVGFSPPRPQRAPPSERQKMCAGQSVRGAVGIRESWTLGIYFCSSAEHVNMCMCTFVG
jgi:hypothetical protein